MEDWPIGVRVNFVEIFPCNIVEGGGVGKEGMAPHFFSSFRRLDNLFGVRFRVISVSREREFCKNSRNKSTLFPTLS